MNQRRIRLPPVPFAVSATLLGVLLLTGAVVLRRSRQARLIRLQDRLNDAGVQGKPRSESEKTALKPAECTSTEAAISWQPALVTVNQKQDYETFLDVRGLTPAVLTPSTGRVVRMNLFDEQSPAAVLQTVQTLLGDDHTLSAGDEAMIWGTASTVQRQGQAHFHRFTERLQQSGDTLGRLLTEYRSEYQPMREGSLLHALLPTLFPDGLPDGFTLRRAEVRRKEGSEPSPVSPWLLLREDEHDLAVQALLDALSWAPDLAPQASVLLEYHR